VADEEKFDAVVVGAGPAGTAAALTMAKAGLQVALLERGSKPGSKNVMGGILYNHFLEEIVGDAWHEAPLERPIIEEQRWLMTDEAAIRLVGYKNLRNRVHPHSFSVLRARFDAAVEQPTQILVGDGDGQPFLPFGRDLFARCHAADEHGDAARDLALGDEHRREGFSPHFRRAVDVSRTSNHVGVDLDAVAEQGCEALDRRRREPPRARS